MDRRQIGLANSLFYERDRLVGVLAAVESGKGLAVSINGTYQADEVVAAAKRPLIEHFRTEIKKIDADLAQLGWSGR
ncbi:hypothetical protein C6A77_19295 [Pseudomonas sp. AFG_SD02_1510_Pfu_092]|uniref:hypothetical protein n=1 Tax=Pseudomonas sp. AFG_SD02_1510_Pfu_092 TaxID=2259497 RepID=UPI000DEF7117|nr:hypothetical protein [Pseudomonas sp. AFG_SD02_1510_Pfu_092]RCL22985.1 hypothetical protein C6A77_19295 [Pseudomonas sp. AFG_SD02_1510_Pfu_092]